MEGKRRLPTRRPRNEDINFPRRPGEDLGPTSAQRSRLEETPRGPVAQAAASVTRGRDESNSMNQLAVQQPNNRANSSSSFELHSNYFLLKNRPDFHLFQYHVDFLPDVDHIGVRKALLRHHESMLGKYLFDGSMLFSVNHFGRDSTEVTSQRNDGTNVKIKIRLVNELTKHDHGYNQVMNIILKRCLHMLNLVKLGRDYYDSGVSIPIPDYSLKLWPGYITTIRPHDAGYLLNIEITHKILREDSALAVLGKVRNEHQDSFENRARIELLGKIVMTCYNNKTYRVDDIAFDMNPMSTFHLRKEDRDITYADYYWTRYKERITNLTQPLLISRPSRRDINRGDTQPIYLVPEICRMTGLSDDQRTNISLKNAVGSVTRVSPGRRIESIMKFRRRLAENPAIQQELGNWGLQFEDNVIRCEGRFPKDPQILLGSGTPFVPGFSGWSRQIQSNRMANPPEIFAKWAVIFPSQHTQDVKNFVTSVLMSVSKGMQYEIPYPELIPIQSDRINDYTCAVDDACKSSVGYNMFLFVLKHSQADRYQSIKVATLCRNGVLSQVITLRNMTDQRKRMSVGTKLMIQIFAKLGGEPWIVANLPISSKHWMVVGYDIYRDARQQRAVGAFVASTNANFSRFFSKACNHNFNEDISPFFRENTLEALKEFWEKNNKELPSKIIVYRDGIGEGDLNSVKEIEIEGIKSAIAEAKRAVNAPNHAIGLEYVIVSKRINTRFFQNRNGSWANPMCGTVVDNVVTLPERMDFFLVSQNANQGTVSPTSYNIICNTGGLSIDHHQRLAYYLTHLYYNWAGTLSVPAPVQYAHKLAYLCGESLKNDRPNHELRHKPYYL